MIRPPPPTGDTQRCLWLFLVAITSRRVSWHVVGGDQERSGAPDSPCRRGVQPQVTVVVSLRNSDLARETSSTYVCIHHHLASITHPSRNHLSIYRPIIFLPSIHPPTCYQYHLTIINPSIRLSVHPDLSIIHPSVIMYHLTTIHPSMYHLSIYTYLSPIFYLKSIHTPTHLSFHSSICPSIHPYLCVDPSLHPSSLHPFVHASIHLPIHPSIHPYLCIIICLSSIHPSSYLLWSII